MIVLVVLAYFYMKNQTPAAAPPASPPAPSPNPATPPGTPLMSQPAAVSQPSAVSQPAPVSMATDMVTPSPVAMSSGPTGFIAGVTSAENEGNAATLAPIDPFSTYPSGFQTWANSLGPQNRSHLLIMLPSMTPTDVNFINNMVNQNLWGQASVAAQWNLFCKTYGFPVSGKFNNFEDFKR